MSRPSGDTHSGLPVEQRGCTQNLTKPCRKAQASVPEAGTRRHRLRFKSELKGSDTTHRGSCRTAGTAQHVKSPAQELAATAPRQRARGKRLRPPPHRCLAKQERKRLHRQTATAASPSAGQDGRPRQQQVPARARGRKQRNTSWERSQVTCAHAVPGEDWQGDTPPVHTTWLKQTHPFRSRRRQNQTKVSRM